MLNSSPMETHQHYNILSSTRFLQKAPWFFYVNWIHKEFRRGMVTNSDLERGCVEHLLFNTGFAFHLYWKPVVTSILVFFYSHWQVWFAYLLWVIYSYLLSPFKDAPALLVVCRNVFVKQGGDGRCSNLWALVWVTFSCFQQYDSRK